MWLIIFGWNHIYVQFFSAWVHEDEDLCLLKSIKWWSLCEIEVVKWAVFSNPAFIRTDSTSALMGSALPGDVWLQYWFGLMTHSSNRFLVDWWALSEGSDSCPTTSGSNSSTPHHLFLLLPPKGRQWSEISTVHSRQFVGATEDLCNIIYCRKLQIDHTFPCINTLCALCNSGLKKIQWCLTS